MKQNTGTLPGIGPFETFRDYNAKRPQAPKSTKRYAPKVGRQSNGRRLVKLVGHDDAFGASFQRITVRGTRFAMAFN